MRIIKIIFFILLALSLIICTGIFILFETFDTDQYMSQITKKASLVLGRPVTFGHMGLGFSSKGITLDAGPLIVADDSNFTTQPFIKIDRIRISLDLRQLILLRKIHVTGVLLQYPQIHFIRSQAGSFNAQSIGRVVQAVDHDMTGRVEKPYGDDDVSSMDKRGQGPVFNPLKSEPLVLLKIQNASISFIDQSQDMPMDIWLTDINASMNGSLLSKHSFQISSLSLNSDLSRLDIKQFRSVSTQKQDFPNLKNMTGILKLNIKHLGIGASGDIESDGDVNVTGVMIKNFNVIKTILFPVLPVLGGMDGMIDKLGADDTIINTAQAQFSFHDKTIFINSSLIQTNIFELTAQGTVDQGLNTDLQTMLRLNNDVSSTVVNEVEGLKYLMDDSQRIAIGASLKGVFPHLKYKPNKDFKKKSKKALIEEGGNILGALLGGR